MRILSIGSDRKLFDLQSAVAQRTVVYGKKIGALSVVVFSLKSQNFSITKLSSEVTVYPTNSANRWMYVFDAIRLGKKIVVEEKFVRGDSVVTCQDPFEAGLVGWRIARYFRFPLHLQIHTDFLSPYFKTSYLQRVRVLLGRFLLPKASRIRVVSERIKTSLIKHHIRLHSEIDVLPIRVNVQQKQSERVLVKKFPQFDFVIFMACRLEKEKRVKDAITACASVIRQFPRVGLVIAGNGREEFGLKEYVAELGLQKSVVFLGWVDTVQEYIATSEVFLSTSEYEGYGMSIIEAGLLGIPVVTTDVGIADELLVNGKNSFVCPVGDTMCITRALVDLLVHNEKRYMLSDMLKHDVSMHIQSEEQYIDAYVGSLKKTIQLR